MTRQEREELKQERIKRVIYAGISCILTGVVAWRAITLLLQNTLDATIILACCVMWLVMRWDIFMPQANTRRCNDDGHYHSVR